MLFASKVKHSLIRACIAIKKTIKPKPLIIRKSNAVLMLIEGLKGEIFNEMKLLSRDEKLQ